MIGFNEDKFKSYIEPQLKRGRAGDWEHSQRVVKWVKELGEGRDDLPLLIIAGYVHDIGWRDVVGQKLLSVDEILKYEPQANKNTRPFITEILKKFDYSDEDIEKVVRLVNAADAHHSNADDEMVLVDADNLSKLNMGHISEKFEKSDWKRVYNELWMRDIPKAIKTDKGKKIYPQLMEEMRKIIL
ncbi:HD domain-containing protein [Patescibacteria group bacterium]